VPIARRGHRRRRSLAVEAVIGLLELAERHIFEDSSDLPRCANRDRRCLIELRGVPVHFGQCEDLRSKLGDRCIAGMGSQQDRLRHAQAGVGPVVRNAPSREQQTNSESIGAT
jgi:hypothetical protein